MTQPQRLVILCGCALAVLSLLFPPYFGTVTHRGDDMHGFLGYRFFLYAPSKAEVYERINGGAAYLGQEQWRWAYARVDTDRAYLQLVVIVLVTVGTVAALRRQKEPV